MPSVPMAQVLVGCMAVRTLARTQASISASLCTWGPGVTSSADQLRGRRGGKEAAHEFDDVAQAGSIGLGLQQVELDLRLVARVGRTQRHLAAAFADAAARRHWTRYVPHPCASRETTAARKSTPAPPASAGRAGRDAARFAPVPGRRSASAPGCRCETSSIAAPTAPAGRAAAGCRSRILRWRCSRRSSIGGPAGSRPRRARRGARECHAARDPAVRRCPRAAATAAN